MKYLILIAALFVSFEVKAEATAASAANPQHIEQERDGKVKTYDGDEWIVVKRRKGPKPAAKPAPVCEPKVVKVTETKTETKYVTQKVEQRKNRLSLAAGQGPNPGIDTSTAGVSAEARTKVGAVGAVQYQRLLTERVSAGLQLQSNKTTLIELGFDF